MDTPLLAIKLDSVRGARDSGGRQKGTSNKHKPFRAMLDALLEEIEQRKGEPGIPTLRDVGIALFSSAAGGNAQAMALLAERLDGKVPQQLQGTDEEGEAGPLMGVVYVGSSAETDAASEAAPGKNTKATEILYGGAGTSCAVRRSTGLSLSPRISTISSETLASNRWLLSLLRSPSGWLLCYSALVEDT
jgi:hypothetical protein